MGSIRSQDWTFLVSSATQDNPLPMHTPSLGTSESVHVAHDIYGDWYWSLFD